MGEEQRKNDNMDFTTGSIFKKLVGFMLPILGALILQTMYGAVDVLVVGRFGTDESISAVSTGSSLINMVVFILCGLAMGVTVLMGRYIGEGERRRLGRVIGGAILTFALIAAALTVLLLVFAPGLASLMQAPADAYQKTVSYIRICGGGIVFIIGYNLMSSIFRGIGNSRLPLLFVGIACAVNVAGDLLFVAVFRWDVAGAAFATVLAQAVSLVLSLLVCRKIELPFSLQRSDLAFSSEVKRFILLGIPIAFQEFLTQLSFMCLLSFVNGMGTTEAMRLAASSGYGIANKLVSVVMLVPSALMQSMSSFIAQNVGAGRERRAQKSMGYGMLFGGCIGIAMTAAAFFGGQVLASLFTDNALYQLKAAEYLQGFSLEAIVTSVLFSFIGYYNGHNQTLFVMLQGIAQSFLVRLPMAYAMSRYMPDSLVYIGAAAPTATVFGIVINLVYFQIYSKKELQKEKR
ncbi:MAG: MATE family efflux transporter [Muribaculaceae bacterium]|nr:MATE family efflux transporter [Roseburia sp.]MCM1431632.1 MATE family efflux transporter [Muribaculaceae bacterium]MCM1492097.1 MATE family efflux transporter [Muribaculaceae bacterium]